MEFRILGPLEVREAGRLLRLGGRRQRALLGVLLLHPNEPLSNDRLIHELWGSEPPETAAKMVHNNVSRLRRLLEPEPARPQLLVTVPLGYELRIGPEQLDANRFERLVEQAREAFADGAAEVASTTLRDALALWYGQALADFADEPFAQAEIGRLEELRLTAVEDRVEADLALGRHSDLVGELEALAAQNPLRERLRGHLMLALYRAGRQAEALSVYQQTRELLVERLGIEPSRALQRLERAILLQEPSLELEQAPVLEAAEAPVVERTREVRKTVSVVFAELLPVGARLDPEALRRPMSGAVEVVSRVLDRYGARVEKLPTGALVGVFGIPAVHEDDPLRAVRAAVELRDSLAELDEELERAWKIRVAVRSAVNTGEVVVGDTAAGPEVTAGDAIDAAARLEQAAAPGEILLGDPTKRLLEELVRIEPADASGAWKLLDLVAAAPAVPRRIDRPLVGRQRELAELRRAFDQAVHDRTPFVFTVLGAAGIGKTRLVAEFAASVEEQASVFTGRCLPYGEAITFWPIAEIVRQAAGDDVQKGVVELASGSADAEVIAERVAAAIGLVERTNPREETFWAMRKLFEALGRERPAVVVFEDLHWAEPTLLDLIEHVAEWAHDVPLLLVCIARSELLDTRPAWVGARLNAASTVLGPLSGDESEALLKSLVPRAELPAETLAAIARVAEGNPFFLEQMLAILSEDGLEGGELRIPPTIQAVLAARLDRLPPDERAVLERASIVGNEFWRTALLDILPPPGRDSLDAKLRMLVRRELIRPHRSIFPGDDAFRFHHLLLREAAYDSVPKQARIELHERCAAWLERAAGARGREFEEIVGHHLEQAFRYQAELEPASERGRELARQAAERLAAAGRRAHARGDLPAAVGLLMRACALLEPGAAERTECLVDLGEALRETADHDRAGRVLDEAAESASRAGDEALAAHVRIARLRLQVQTDPEITTEELLREAKRAVRIFERLGEERHLAKAWELLAWVPWYRCRAADAEAALQQAVEHARRAADRRTEAQSLHFLVGAVLFGPRPAADGIRRCEELLAQPGAQRRVRASVLRAVAGLKAMQGAFDEARAAMDECRVILEDLGLRVTAASAAETHGIVELLAGDAAAAERELRRGYETLEQLGEANVAPVVAALLAQALHAQGRDEEALRFSELSEEATAPDDLSAHVQWRAARAKALAQLGKVDAAEALAYEAVTLASETDFLVVHGDALMDLAEVLRVAGRPAEAASAIADALGYYERKGNVVAARRAKTVLAELAVPT